MTDRLPLFPLNAVLLPGGLLPLRIFEARYLDMVSDCLRNDSEFGICLIDSGEEVGKAAKIRKLGTLVKIIDWDKQPDGLLEIWVQGQQKFQVLETDVQSNELLTGIINRLPAEASTPLPEEFLDMKILLQHILEQLKTPLIEQPVTEDAGWIAGRLIEWLPLPLDEKQQLLEMDDSLSRLFRLRDVMTGL